MVSLPGWRWGALGMLAVLAGCAAPHRAPVISAVPSGPARARPTAVVDDHVPPFANQGWEPFSRGAAVAVAEREWRVFRMPVDDDPPDTRPEPAAEDKPERQQGLWQRVGEYFWEGLDPGEKESPWTGTHDENGQVFDARVDGFYAWSAVFISYVMRIAGAGDKFPYAVNHATYINLAASGAAPGLRAHAPADYAPRQGDLICTGRDRSRGIRFSDLPTSNSFPSHCDIVVEMRPGELSVLGGNVDDAVTEKHVPVMPDGRLAGPDGTLLDTRYPWFVVLEVLYEA